VVDLTAYANYDNEFLQWMASTKLDIGDGQLVDVIFDLADPTANPLQFIMPASDITFLAQFKPKDLQAGAQFGTGDKWSYLNVDAPGTFTAAPEDPGMFYQWNRPTGWSVTDPLSSSDGSAWDSTEDQSNVWADENDPCPIGWRVPTVKQFERLLDPYYTQQILVRNAGGVLVGAVFVDEITKNFIHLPFPGYRDNMGNLWNPMSYIPSYGNYLSSSISEAGTVEGLSLSEGYSMIDSMYLTRNIAASVRCVEYPGDGSGPVINPPDDGGGDDGGGDDGGGPIIIIPPGDGGGDIW
jgi:hypothetical protein